MELMELKEFFASEASKLERKTSVLQLQTSSSGGNAKVKSIVFNSFNSINSFNYFNSSN